MEFRCRRSGWCARREAVHDPVSGDFLEYVGCPIESSDGLCTICESKVLDALIHLPGDVEELTQLIGKPLSGGVQEYISGQKPGPSIPVQVHLEALRALIDHETMSWAKSTAEADGFAKWSSLQMHQSRPAFRVKAACCLLRQHLPVFLSLGPVEHRARSLGVRRGDGHDEEVMTVYGDDYWVTRDGLEGAILLLDLHSKAWKIAQRHQTPTTESIPCRSCGWMTLRRFPGDSRVKCSYCGHEIGEDDLDVLKSALAKSLPA